MIFQENNILQPGKHLFIFDFHQTLTYGNTAFLSELEIQKNIKKSVGPAFKALLKANQHIVILWTKENPEIVQEHLTAVGLTQAEINQITIHCKNRQTRYDKTTRLMLIMHQFKNIAKVYYFDDQEHALYYAMKKYDACKRLIRLPKEFELFHVIANRPYDNQFLDEIAEYYAPFGSTKTFSDPLFQTIGPRICEKNSSTCRMIHHLITQLTTEEQHCKLQRNKHKKKAKRIFLSRLLNMFDTEESASFTTSLANIIEQDPQAFDRATRGFHSRTRALLEEIAADETRSPVSPVIAP